VPDHGVRLRRRLVSSDPGLSLIELVVAMAIFSGILAVGMSVLLTVQQQTRDTALRDDAVGEARVALSTMDRQVRSGNVLYNPADEAALGFPMSMRIYTQSNATKKCVQWQIVPDSAHPGIGLIRSRSWSPGWQLDPVPASAVSGWATVARGLLNTATDPVAPFQLEGSGTSTAYGSRLVTINLLVKSPDDAAAAGGRPITVRTSLSGRNTLYGFDPGVCSPIPSA